MTDLLRVPPDECAPVGVEGNIIASELLDSSYADMLLSESVLAQDWDSPEDDDAWAYLSHFQEVPPPPGGSPPPGSDSLSHAVPPHSTDAA
jgi:hypothetical protein